MAIKKFFFVCIGWFCYLAVFLSPAPNAYADATLELYGTFHAMGVIVHLDAGDDPNENALATVAYRTGSEAYQAGFPPVRIASDRFVGSIFWLEPGTVYDVQVTISDPDGGALNGQVLQQSMTTREEISVSAPTAVYYVYPDGTGSDCTLASPCALTTGLSQAHAGEAVILRGGVYATGGLSLPRSGSEGAPIVIQSHSGETAILDGAHQSIFTWEAVNGGVYRTMVNETSIHLVLADGQRLFPYESQGDLRTLSYDNTPGFYQEGTTLFVRLENDKDPNTATMVISCHETAFTVEQDYIYFLDLTFKHYGQGGYPKAIYMNNASDNLVQNCTFINNDLGVGLKRESHRNVIQDNVFSDTIFNWPWQGIKDVGGLEDGGISFYDPLTGRGTVIRRNTFHDDFDGMGVCPATTSALTNETDVYDNVVYRMGDDGMETDGQCSNVRIWGNTFHDVLMGISLAPVYDGPVYAIRNLIYRTGVGNNNYTGSPFKFNSDYPLSGYIYLFHNTADAVLPGNNGLYIKSPGSWRLIYARNNIWAGTDYAMNNYNTAQPLDMDYDNFFNAGSNDLIRWNSARYATLDTFSEENDQEANGLNLVPGFIDATGGLYALETDSDLANAGIYIPGINHDYTGSAPDIGAFEIDTGNHTPVAHNDAATTEPDTTVFIDVMANDRDADGDPLTIESHSATSANGGTVERNGSGLAYSPAAGFNGMDTFNYTVTDGEEISNMATVTVTVQGSDPGDENPPVDDTGDGGGGSGCFLDALCLKSD